MRQIIWIYTLFCTESIIEGNLCENWSELIPPSAIQRVQWTVLLYLTIILVWSEQIVRNLSKVCIHRKHRIENTSELPDHYDSELKLKFVRIFFYATTFDRITKDRAAKFVDMLSAIGGTMGLLTGFSIISGVEIVYFGIKIILKILKDRLKQKQMKHIA